MKSGVNGLDHRLSFRHRNSALTLSFAGEMSLQTKGDVLSWGTEGKRQQTDYPSPTWTAFPIVLSQQVATRDLWPDQHSQVLIGPQQPSQRPSLTAQRVAF